jgi:hypothetical protein
MHEAMMLFESIVNSEWFVQSKVVLCFTKMDVLQRKIDSNTSPIADHFPDYEGSPTDVEAVKTYFTEKFTSLLRPKRTEIDVCYLDVTESNDVQGVWSRIVRADFSPSENYFTFRNRHDSIVHDMPAPTPTVPLGL